MNTKTALVSVPSNTDYDVIGGEGKWSFIRFNEPVVSVWVNLKSVTINSSKNTATIIIDNENARFNPSLNSFIVHQIRVGYEAKIIEIRNDFVKIFAPLYFEYAIDYQSKQVSQSAGWVMQSNKASPDLSSQSSEGDIKGVLQSENYSFYQGQQLSVNDLSEQNTDGVTAQNDRINDSNSDAVLVDQVDLSEDRNQYLLKSGDTISIIVFGETDLNLPSTRIPQSGVISFPLIGPVEVVNKTTQEVEEVLISALSKGYINSPRLTVAIDSYRPIFIKGAVNTTGAFVYTEGLTIAQALSLAGGTSKIAKPFGVSVERDGRIVQQNLSLNSNVKITSGDVLSVEEEIGYSEEGQLLYVYLHGEVNRPGEYKYRPGLTVEKAVVLAGGFSLRASKKKISVSRYTDDQEIPETLKKVPLYLPVKPGDIINVGASWF